MGLLDRASMRLLEGLRLRTRPQVASLHQGGQRSRALASGVEFADHREYAPGDDVRQIDWKAFARHRQLTVRVFEEERDVRVTVLLDLSASMGRGKPPKLELARKLVGAFGYLGMKQLDRVQVVPFAEGVSEASPAWRNRGDYPGLEGFLAQRRLEGVGSLWETARTFVERHPARGLLVVVTDLMEALDLGEPLRLLGRAGHQVVLVRVRCREDDEPAFSGETELVDSETGERLRLTMGRSLLAAYRKEIAEHVQRVRLDCQRIGARFVEAPVEEPTVQVLRAVLAVSTEAR